MVKPTGVSQLVSLPQVSGPLPDTSTHGVQVWDMSGLGYVAEEYVLAGKADTYAPVGMADAANAAERDTTQDLARRDFALEPRSFGEPYKTRLVVYRPRDVSRFSGNVVVEPFHPLGGGIGVVWNSIQYFFVANGDAYVGFQHPATLSGLCRSGAGRYDGLAMVDNTQLWDGLAQTAALLRSGAAQSPLRGYPVRHLFLTGVSYTGVATSGFANYHHPIKKTADGHNLFDGYVSMENATYDRPIDVPVIKLNTQGDFDSFGALGNRRPDSDEKGQQYRLYEVPGWSHVTAPRPVPGATGKPPHQLGAAAEVEASSEWLRTTAFAQFPKEAQPNDFPGFALSSAAFSNMYAWVRGERTPPRAARIETDETGATRLDAHGNALGGLRTPYVDVPIAKYAVGTGYPGFLFGYKIPLELERRRALYGSHASYVERVRAQTERLSQERWILADGAREIVREAEASSQF
jgi:hypothetical protein